MERERERLAKNKPTYRKIIKYNGSTTRYSSMIRSLCHSFTIHST